MDAHLQVLKESKKVSSTATVSGTVYLSSHITFRDCPMHIFSDNLSWNSCIFNVNCLHDLFKIYQVSKENVSTALSYDFTLLFPLTQLGDGGV